MASLWQQQQHQVADADQEQMAALLAQVQQMQQRQRERADNTVVGGTPNAKKATRLRKNYHGAEEAALQQVADAMERRAHMTDAMYKQRHDVQRKEKLDMRGAAAAMGAARAFGAGAGGGSQAPRVHRFATAWARKKAQGKDTAEGDTKIPDVGS